jgi:hypothetical protein
LDWLNKVAQHHNEWVTHIHTIGKTSHAEDIVQEMYLKLVRTNKSKEVILENGKVHKSYIYRALNNLLVDYYRSAKKFSFVDVDECRDLQTDQSNPELEQAYERIMKKMHNELSKLDEPDKYNYNEELFYLKCGYDDLLTHPNKYSKPLSMRKIEAVSTISLTSIFNTIKNCKEQLSEELREDLEDFRNEEYELI